MKVINLQFDGYWREISKAWITPCPGLYCVYRCAPLLNGRLLLHELIYIGQSENVNSRITNHERVLDWQGSLLAGEELCYTVAEVRAQSDRDVAEAALINEVKPRFNSDFIDSYSFEPAIISCGGTNGLLPRQFIRLGK